ncbi:MAG: peptide deformylase [Oscillospiraceae bacterium]|nr:peptide deformylase [Oscillospiraceae bacterium]
MIKDILHDPVFIAAKSEPATADDLQTAADMVDTITANKDACIGMAANMIGVLKRIIVFDDGGKYTVMFNPEIIRCEKPYKTEEGCLSLTGGPRPVERYKTIKVRWQNEKFEPRVKMFSGITAQIIQHEIDHCNGVLI